LHERITQLKVVVWQNEAKIINVFRDAHANCQAAKEARREIAARWLREERRTWRCLVLHRLLVLGPQRRQRAGDEQRDGGEQEGGGGSAA
jgi:hypothetical protein